MRGHHVQFNVVDATTLREAQARPDEHRDLIVATEEAKLGLPEAKVGVAPVVILPPLLRAVPRAVLREMILTGELDHVNENDFYMKGGIDEVLAAAGKSK